MQQSSLEPLLFQIRGRSYRPRSQAHYHSTSLIESFEKEAGNKTSQTFYAPSQAFKPSQGTRGRFYNKPNKKYPNSYKGDKSSQNMKVLNKIFQAKLSRPSIIKVCFEEAEEKSQENNFKSLNDKIHASKAPVNSVITLGDLAQKRRNLTEENLKIKKAPLQQAPEDKLNTSYYKQDKSIRHLKTEERSFEGFSPIRKAGDVQSSFKFENENSLQWMQDKRFKLIDQLYEASKEVAAHKNREGIERSFDTQFFDITMTECNKSQFVNNNNNYKVGSKEDLNEDESVNKTNLPLEANSSFLSAFAVKRKTLKSRERSQKKIVNEAMNNTTYVQNDEIKRAAIAKRIADKKFDVYHQVATEEERDKMSDFLKDEFVNEILLNRFNVNMDKFQIKDAMAEMSKKAKQNKGLRQMFHDFLKNGGKKGMVEYATQLQEIKPRGTLKKGPLLDFTDIKRKNSETLLQDSSDEDASISGKEEEKPKLNERAKSRMIEKETSLEREHPFARGDHRKKNLSAEKRTLKSAGSTGRDDLQTSKDFSKDESERREIERIRLLEMKKELNKKLKKNDEDKQDPTKVVGINVPGLTKKPPPGQDKFTLFMQAVKSGNREVVRKYLESNPNFVSECDMLKQTPLHWAAQKGHSEICQILIENGANVNAYDMGDKTPLYYAVKERFATVVKLLLSSNKIRMTLYGDNGITEYLNKVRAGFKHQIDLNEKKENSSKVRKRSLCTIPSKRESIIVKKIETNKAI